MYGVYTVFLAGKPPNIRSHVAHIYGFGQPLIVCVPAQVGIRCSLRLEAPVADAGEMLVSEDHIR